MGFETIPASGRVGQVVAEPGQGGGGFGAGQHGPYQQAGPEGQAQGFVPLVQHVGPVVFKIFEVVGGGLLNLEDGGAGRGPVAQGQGELPGAGQVAQLLYKGVERVGEEGGDDIVHLAVLGINVVALVAVGAVPEVLVEDQRTEGFGEALG